MSLKTPEYQLNYFTDPFDKKTEIVFLNTCGFISSWRDEADAMVKKLLKSWKTVYLMWCAVQYYKKLQEQGQRIKDKGGNEKEIVESKLSPRAFHLVPSIHYLSRGDLNTVTLKNILQWYDSKSYGDFQFAESPRVYTNLEQKFEYLKIAEW
jgi:tRNA A37 methylthiotransferase MiaB